MPKDILLFGFIQQYNAMFFFDQINEATKEDGSVDLVARINTDGGSPEYAMSIIEKVQEMQNQFSAKVGAMCHSMGLFLLAYIDVEKTECIDTTQALLHRAAWPDWIESSPSYKGSIYEQTCAKTNKDLEKAFRARVDVAALESLPQMKEKNATLKDIFSMDGRIEVMLFGADLKKIGLVSRVNKITPTKTAELTAQIEEFNKCTSLGELRMAARAINANVDEPIKITNMTPAELKEKFPAVHAAIKAEGHAEGVTAGLTQEKERIENIMVFSEIDPVAVKAAIESGKPLTPKQTSEFMLKAAGNTALAAVKKDSTGAIITEVVTGEESEKQKNIAKFEGELNARLGIKKETKAA